MSSPDLFSSVSDARLLQLMLADMQDDLHGRLVRFRYLTDQSGALGKAGTMIFGGAPAVTAFGEARSSFVNGNFIATILLCQSLAENTLAALLHDAEVAQLPTRISFKETLARCRAQNVITSEDVIDLQRLAELRNPLIHFRNINDPSNLDRRAMSEQTSALEILERDAYFAIAAAIKLMGRRAFRVDR